MDVSQSMVNIAKLSLLSDIMYSFDKQMCFREWFV